MTLNLGFWIGSFVVVVAVVVVGWFVVVVG